MAGSTANNARKRLYILGAILFLWIGAIGVRLVQLQIIRYPEWLQRAQRQQQRSIEVGARRGVIYDRNGHELAMSIMVDSVFAVPSEIPDPATTASLLARILHADPEEVLTRLKSSRSFAWIARKVDGETSQRLHALNLRGIYFQQEPKRFYPKRELAAQAVGWVGLDDEGLGGIEHAFDARLRGQPGRMLITMDARKRWFGRVEKQPDPGENVVLTIDEKIQYIAERELEKAMQDTHAESGTVIVQNPHTGEILALANRPTFNPNNAGNAPREALKNPAVSDIYEPGSVFKIVTYSAALQEQLIKPDDPIDTQGGVITIGNIRIHDLHKMGVVPVSKALAESSDVAAVKIGMRLGDDRFYHYIRDYGFGTPTGIELPGETRGMTKPVNRWSKVSIGAISIGQEIGVSALQLTAVVSAIANDGVWTAPRIVAGVTPPRQGLQTIAFHPVDARRVVSTTTAVEMKKLLEGVVLSGTGRRALLDGYTSAGKTGTAQKVDPATGAYSRSKYVATFAGFAPVNNPAITVVVILDSAVGLHQGGQISAPVFARIAQQVLAYMNVPHDLELKDMRRRQMLASVRDEDLSDSTPDELGEGLEVADSTPPPAPPPVVAPAPTARLVPAAVVSKQLAPPPEIKPQPEAPLPTHGTVVLNVDGGVVVPSLLGKTLRAAIETAQAAGLEIEAIGSGVAQEQSPAAGTHIAPGARIAVRFSR